MPSAQMDQVLSDANCTLTRAERVASLQRVLQRELADLLIRCAPIDEIRVVLACGAKVNEPVAQGLRPIHYAIYQQYQRAVELLLVRGCQVDAMDDVGYTALHLCAEKGFLELAQLLIDHGAKVCFTDIEPPEGRTYYGNPPRVTMADEPLRIAIRNDHFEMAELLLKHGANPNARYYSGTELSLVSPLALSYVELLLRYGADPNPRDRGGLTPLMKAARHPQGYDAVETLVKFGADVNATAGEPHDFRSVLHYGALSSNLDTVKLLLSKGANVNVPEDYIHPRPLDLAVLKGNIDVIRLLLDFGAEVNKGSPIVGSPLHIALSEYHDNCKEIVQLLLESGADPNFVTHSEQGKPFLKPPIGEYFLRTEPIDNRIPRDDIVRLLLKYGARLVMSLQAQCEMGILKSIQSIQEYPEILDTVLECCENLWSLNSLKRSVLLKPAIKEQLLEHAQTPQTLKQQVRNSIRNQLGATGPQVVEKVKSMQFLPRCLTSYLLYEV